MKYLNLIIINHKELRSVINTVLAYTSLNIRSMSIDFKGDFVVCIGGDKEAITTLERNLMKKNYKTVKFI